MSKESGARQNPPRVLYFSALNVAACLAVVYLHVNGCFWEGPAGPAWLTSNVIETFFYWAVPIFFMLTGATLMDYRQRMGTQEYLRHRVARTVVPYIVWSLVATTWYAFERTPPSLADVISNLLSPRFMSIYWFFMPLFGIYLSLPVLSRISSREKLFDYMIGASVLLQSVMPLACTLVGVSYDTSIIPVGAAGYVVYPLLGYRLAHRELAPRQRALLYVLGTVGWLLQLFGTLAVSTPEAGVVRTWKGYTNLPALIQAVAVFVAFKYADRRIGSRLPTAVQHVTLSLAKVTFGVYLIHYYFVYYMPGILGFDSHVLAWRLVGPLLIFALAGLLTAAMRSVPVLRKAVGG